MNQIRYGKQVISIHALREESDADIQNVREYLLKFQSTLSVRRATSWRALAAERRVISIHALREESDTAVRKSMHDGAISIHALREESDIKAFTALKEEREFQSTLSVRRATRRICSSV